MVTVAAHADGRHRRRQHNRELVIDALVELFENGVYQPSADEIAAQAGVSPRSLFRYFDDLDDLSQAAIARLLDRAQPYAAVAVDPRAPLSDRIDAFVAARTNLHEATAAAARAARITAHRRPHVASQLARSRAFLTAQVKAAFATELADGRRHLLPAIDALCSFETYDLFRTTHRMSRARAATVMAEALRALLGSPGETG